MRYFKKVAFTLSASLLMVGAIVALHGVAFASVSNPNHGYFTGAGPQFNGFGQVITCGFTAPSAGCPQIDPAGGACSTLMPGITNKSTFEAFITNTISAGGRDATGAEFIVQQMLGGTDHTRPSGAAITDWKSRIDNAAVTIKCTNSVNYGGWNSGYMKGVADDDAFFSEPGSASALEFDYNGTPYFYLKVICANPIGDLPGLPAGATGNINGIKVLPSGAGAPAPAGTASITISGPANSSGTSNPFFFNGIPTGNYTVTAANVPGYTVVGSTWCQGASCNPGLVGGSNYRTGNTTTVTVAANSTAQMRWIYQSGGGPPPPTACPGQPGIDVTHVPASFPQGEPTTFNPDGSYTVRVVTAHHITSATDANTGAALPHDDTTVNFSSSAAAFPYDTNTANVTYVNEYDATTYDASGNVISGPTHYSTSAPRSGSATLGECYWRKFVIQPMGQGGASFNNYENPSTATITDLINVTFGYDGPSPDVVRSPMKVNGINLGPSTLIVRRHNPNGTTTDLPYPYPSPLNAYPNSFTSSTTVSVNYRATMPLLQYGDEICFVLTANPGSGDMDENGNIKPPIGGPNSDNGPTEPICSAPLTAKPYLRVFGGDIDVGAGTAALPTCSAANSSINAWNQGSAGGYAGSAVQFGAEAYDIITGTTGSGTGFASALGNGASASAAGPPNGLTLANTGGNTFGGCFGSDPTIPDYPGQLALQGITPTGGGNIAGRTLKPTDPLNVRHTTIYATGSVFIQNNIVYTSVGWVDPSMIPSFKLIVYGGNIYIDHNITELDGLYVAEPNASGNGGSIYTCATGLNTLVPANQLFSNCGSQLVVNGSFVAKKVYFQRTHGQTGSDFQSTVNEVPSGSHAAEVFVYTPEMWLAETPAPLSQKYDSITSLPPVL